MAQKKKSAALARLVESIEISNPDGTTLMVPVSADANAVLNKIMASQMRALIQKSMEKFGGQDHLTPKELKELTEAARNVAEFSGEVYKSGEEINEPGEKRVEAISTDIIDYSKLKTQLKPGKSSAQVDTPESSEDKGKGVDNNETA